MLFGLQHSNEIRQMQNFFLQFSPGTPKSQILHAASIRRTRLLLLLLLRIIRVQENNAWKLLALYLQAMPRWHHRIFRWPLNTERFSIVYRGARTLNPECMGWTTEHCQHARTRNVSTAQKLVHEHDESSERAAHTEINNEFDWRKR